MDVAISCSICGLLLDQQITNTCPHPHFLDSSSSTLKVKGKCESLSHVQLFVTPWTVARQAPLSMKFPRQEYQSRLRSPGDLPDPGIKPGSPALQVDSLLSEPPGKPLKLEPSMTWAYLWVTPLMCYLNTWSCHAVLSLAAHYLSLPLGYKALKENSVSHC